MTEIILEKNGCKLYKKKGVFFLSFDGVEKTTRKEIVPFLESVTGPLKEVADEFLAKMKQKKKSLPKVISKEDARKILNIPNLKTKTGLRNYCALLTIYWAGLRVEELCQLTVDDVMLDENWILVQQGKGRKDRVVPIQEDLKGWLMKWKEARPESLYFFSTHQGEKLDQSYLRRAVYRYSEQAGVYLRDEKRKKPISPHTLRHCFATELLEEGFNIAEARDLMGHSSTQTTSVYLHVRPMALAEKMRKRVV